jgi:putative transposase
MVFVTKYRPGVLNEEMLRCCDDVMRRVCDDFGAELREFNGEHEHANLLVFYPPKVAVSALVNSHKSLSARMLRAEFTGPVNRASMRGHFWSPSYFAASCGSPPLSISRQYIKQQQRPG